MTSSRHPSAVAPVDDSCRLERLSIASEPAVVVPGASGTYLRRLLVGLDLAAATLAWTAALLLAGGWAAHGSALAHGLAVPALAVMTVVLAGWRHLYRGRVCSLRAVELQRLGQATLLVSLVAFLVAPELGLRIQGGEVALGGLLTFALASTFRTGYRNWLSAGRRDGRFQRQVVIVGTNEEAHDLYRLVTNHPELGLHVVGVVGEAATMDPSFDALLLGPISRTEDLVEGSGATGVLVAATALSSPELNRVTRNLLRAGTHVHLSSGLRGFATHRLRPQSFAHEPLLYLEPEHPAHWQLGAKRALDLVFGTFGLVLSLPVLAAAAIAIKLDDGGPVIFRQKRVGRSGRPFEILKLRTMVPDAEARYDELARTLGTGPLVKLHADPRITRVGRFLRATSIDELPQFLNVLRGSMTLVGPRPYQLVEAQADPELLACKGRVRPGITGLWQVEARDNPSFDVYRRLDQFYVENWSVGLDIAILLATTQRVTYRAVRFILSARRPCPVRGAVGEQPILT